MKYKAVIRDRVVSRELGRIVNAYACDHRHETRDAAERCASRLWHQTFGTRYKPTNGQYGIDSISLGDKTDPEDTE